MTEYVEQLPENYEEEVRKYGQKLKDYNQVSKALERQSRTLEQTRTALAQLRLARLSQLLQEKNLGICSVELGGYFFRCGRHQGIEGLTDLEHLGIFEKGKLKLIHLETYIYSKGDHYEDSFYRYHEGLYQICNFHLQRSTEEVFLIPSLYAFPPKLPANFRPIKTARRTEEGSLVNEEGRILDTGLLNQGVYFPIPEAIFQCFQIPQLPQD